MEFPLHIMWVIPASTHSNIHHVAHLPACRTASAIKSGRDFHTPDSPLLIIITVRREVSLPIRNTQLNRASPANDNHREWHTFPSWAIRIKPGGSGPSITCARILLLLNTRSWFQHLRATMRLISQSSWCVIRRCCTICHTRTKTKHNYPQVLLKNWDIKALLFWRGGQSGLYMCVNVYLRMWDTREHVVVGLTCYKGLC